MPLKSNLRMSSLHEARPALGLGGGQQHHRQHDGFGSTCGQGRVANEVLPGTDRPLSRPGSLSLETNLRLSSRSQLDGKPVSSPKDSLMSDRRTGKSNRLPLCATTTTWENVGHMVESKKSRKSLNTEEKTASPRNCLSVMPWTACAHKETDPCSAAGRTKRQKVPRIAP